MDNVYEATDRMRVDPESVVARLADWHAHAKSRPVAGIGLLAWTLYNSRGAYRLSGDVLSAPDHPDVPLASITQIDKSKWDRKGIAKLDYELATGQKGTVTLDDFVYDRPPTDRILEEIEAKLGVSTEVAAGTQPQAAE